MRKFFFLLVLFVSFAVSANAQFKLGITGGLNISQLHVSDNDYEMYIDKNRPGFLIGPTVTYNVNKTGFGCDFSALFDMRGATSKDYSNVEPVYCYSFQFPLNLRYGIDFQEMVYWFLFTGPQFGVNVGSREKYIISGTGKTTGHAMERRWVDDATTISWNLGIGAVLLEHVQVRVSYNWALKNTSTIQQVDLVDGTSRTLTGGRTNSCQIALSYLF